MMLVNFIIIEILEYFKPFKMYFIDCYNISKIHRKQISSIDKNITDFFSVLEIEI